jgi:hypothetical protein
MKLESKGKYSCRRLRPPGMDPVDTDIEKMGTMWTEVTELKLWGIESFQTDAKPEVRRIRG